MKKTDDISDLKATITRLNATIDALNATIITSSQTMEGLRTLLPDMYQHAKLTWMSPEPRVRIVVRNPMMPLTPTCKNQ